MELPASVGKYELTELLGVDPPDVYRGRDTETGRAVVVKMITLPPNAVGGQETGGLARFDRLADPRRRSPLRRRWKVAVALLLWVGLVCADAATHQGILPWIAGGAGVAGVALFAWRRRAEKPATSHEDPSRKSLNS